MKKYKESKFKYNIISKNCIKIIIEFIELSKIILDLHVSVKDNDLNLNALKVYENKFNQFKNFSISENFLIQIKTAIENLEEIKKRKNNSELDSKYNKIINMGKKLSAEILKQNFKSVKNVDIIDDFYIIQKLIQREGEILKKDISVDYLKSGLGSIFNAGKKSGLLSSFDKEDWKELNNKKFNINEVYFNYLPDVDYNDDFESFVYFINKVETDKIEDIELNSVSFQDYLSVIYKNNSEFKKFKDLVEKYLHSNDKSLIKSIIDFLDGFPIIKKENEDRKKQIKILYRGISISPDNPIYQDFLNKKKVDYDYAACSLDRSVAEGFATGTSGILKPSKEGNRQGLLLTYGVDEHSIVIDFNILGSIFGEGEIYINTKKAKLISVTPITY